MTTPTTESGTLATPPPGVSLMGMLAAEEAVRDHQATEALFLTYNADLGFLEARLLGLCQATGARVTVLADGRVWAPDARAVRHAGRGYHAGLAAVPGAFHPKMLVLTGPKRVLVAIGSGNLSMGGWQYNAELLTVFTGDHRGVPAAVAQVSTLLSALPVSVPMDPLTHRALERTVHQLDDLLRGAPTIDTGHTVAGSWQGPLIERLPTGPVAQLLLHAPFHDPKARAIEALLGRFAPQHVQIALQPGWTELDPRALQAVLDRYRADTSAAVDVLADTGTSADRRARYRHGKLIEWVTQDGERFALTGSPNLSVAALLKAPTNGGNHEVAVLGPLPASLFPGGEPLDLATVPQLSSDEGEADEHEPDRHTVSILAALRAYGDPGPDPDSQHEEGVTLFLSRPAPPGVRVEVSQREWTPDTWHDAGAVPAEARQHHVSALLPGGSRIRLRGAHPGGDPWWSATVFVTDPDRVLRRQAADSKTSKTHKATPLDLFGDNTAFLAAVLDDLTRFASETATARGPAAARHHDADDDASPHDHDRHDGTQRIEPWLWIQDDTMQRLGPALGAFALGLPTLTAGDDPTIAWADRLTDEAEEGLEDDTAEIADALTEPDADDHTAEASAPDAGLSSSEGEDPPLDQRADSPSRREARRRWCVRATDLTPNLTLGSRLFVLRTVLRVWSAGNWDPGDAEPLQLLDTLLQSLYQPRMNSDAEARVGSMAAVALTLARAGVDLRSHNEPRMQYRRLVDKYAHLLLAADPDLIEGYTTGLATLDGVTLHPDAVADTCADLTADDRLGDAEEVLTQEGHEITRPAPHVLKVAGKFTNPEPIALRAIGQSEPHSGIAVWAISRTGDWTLVVWREPDLVTITERSGKQRWRHQVLPGHVGPAAIAYQQRSGSTNTRFDVVTKPKHRPTDQARAVLADVGIVDPSPPDS